MAKNSEINLMIILLGSFCLLIITEGEYYLIILILFIFK